jgi:hypothetical protein
VAEYAKFVDIWPLIVIEAPAHATFESIEWFCARQDEILGRRELFASIQDMRSMRGMVDAKSRRAIADWAKARDAEIRRWQVASATVTDSAIARGIITAVHWLSKPPIPHDVTGSMRVATDFVVDHLKQGGVPISAKLADFQRSVA